METKNLKTVSEHVCKGLAAMEMAHERIVRDIKKSIEQQTL